MFTWIDYTFWGIESLAFAGVLISMLLSRSLARWYSLTLYCSIQIAVNVALLEMLIDKSWAPYFYTQWYSEIFFSLIKLLILWQVVIESIGSLQMVPGAIRNCFLLAVLSVGVCAFCYGIRGFSNCADLPGKSLLLNRATSICVVAIFSTFSLFSSFFGLKWRSRALQIDVGLNVIASADLLCFLAQTNLSGQALLSYHIQSGIHIASLCLWCKAFLSPEFSPFPSTAEFRTEIQRVYSELPNHDCVSQALELHQ